MRYHVRHLTTYDYDASVSFSQHQLRLRPRALPRQRAENFAIAIDPVPRDLHEFIDYHGNPAAFATIEGAHSRFAICSEFDVELISLPTPSPSETPAWETVRDNSRGAQIGSALEANEFLFDSPLLKAGDQFADYARISFPKSRPILEACLDLTDRIHEDFAFDPAATDVSTPILQVFKQRRGVCQDFAHLQIVCLRSLGIPGRYISGYISTVPPPGQPKLAGADASHAWVSFYCDGLGWVDLDPTNNLIPNREHITVAWGRDYSDVPPLRGVTLGSGAHSLEVAVDVTPQVG
jgi:transglutaminase-like putative cysteine protease